MRNSNFPLRRGAVRAVAALLMASLAISPALAQQQETDRLREALRAATAQARAAEDQRVALQAKVATMEQERDRLRKQNETLRGQIKEAEQAYRQAVKDFNDSITQRDEVLEKWKDAYGEAATVARSKDELRAKFEAEAANFKAGVKACETKNAQLTKIADDVVKRFEEMSVFEKALDHDPVFGLKRVQNQNEAQDYRDKIIEQRAKP